MKFLPLFVFSTIAATPVFAQESRQLDSHEHGVGQLDIAFDGSQVAMELHAPGADIVGFEYMPEADEDVAKVDEALLVLAQPLALFATPDAAQCNVIEARADLEGEDSHDDHGGEGHDDGDHDDLADEAGHTEFHAEYLLDCGDITALDSLSFTYFTAFPNAVEVEVRVLSDAGATAFEVERDAPVLDLSDLN